MQAIFDPSLPCKPIRECKCNRINMGTFWMAARYANSNMPEEQFQRTKISGTVVLAFSSRLNRCQAPSWAIEKWYLLEQNKNERFPFSFQDPDVHLRHKTNSHWPSRLSYSTSSTSPDGEPFASAGTTLETSFQDLSFPLFQVKTRWQCISATVFSGA